MPAASAMATSNAATTPFTLMSSIRGSVEGASARSHEDVKGHTTCNKVVNFRGSPDLAGSLSKVRVTEAKAHSLYGEFAGAA